MGAAQVSQVSQDFSDLGPKSDAAHALLALLTEAGITAEVSEAGLALRPASRLTDALRDEIRRHRAEMIALLQSATVQVSQVLQDAAGRATKNATAVAQCVSYREWLLHFPDRASLEVWFVPPTTHERVMTDYPDAVAAEPIVERIGRAATTAEAGEMLAPIGAIYAEDSREDGREAVQATLADSDDALTATGRGIVPAAAVSDLADKGLSINHKTCANCRYRRRPGLSAGYCGSGRADLLPAYGTHHPLRRLPDDHGAACNEFEEQI